MDRQVDGIDATSLLQTAPPHETFSDEARPSRAGGQSLLLGDPLIMNVDGEKFDIRQSGSHTFLAIPLGADVQHASLHVHGRVDVRGGPCTGLPYISEVSLAGRWLGGLESLTFFTATEPLLDAADQVVGLRVGESPRNLSVEEFARLVPPELAEVRRFETRRPNALNQHATTLQAKLHVGPVAMKVTWLRTKEPVGFSNSLMLLVAGLGNVQGSVGGLLGEENHTWAAHEPPWCSKYMVRSLARTQQNGPRAQALRQEVVW